MQKHSREAIMKSAIDQMLYGLRGTYESVQASENYSRLMGKVCEIDNKLTQKLKEDKEAAELYKQFKDALDEVTSDENEIYYKEGFRFGVLLGIDVSE